MFPRIRGTRPLGMSYSVTFEIDPNSLDITGPTDQASTQVIQAKEPPVIPSTIHGSLSTLDPSQCIKYSSSSASTMSHCVYCHTHIHAHHVSVYSTIDCQFFTVTFHLHSSPVFSDSPYFIFKSLFCGCYKMPETGWFIKRWIHLAHGSRCWTKQGPSTIITW